jgi:hypothetical protein
VNTLHRACRPGFCCGVAVMVALVAAGCGGGADSLYAVRGTVYLDGQPAKELAGCTVTFTSSELHRSASGEIQADGTYCLGSLTKDDGAIPGKYQVTVSPPERAGGGDRGKKQPGAIGVSFEQPTNPEVTVEQRTNDIPIQLQRSKSAPK